MGEHGVGGLEVAEQEEGVEVNHTLEEVPGAGCEEVMGDGCEEVMGDGCEGVMREDLFGEFADDLFLPSAERRRQSRAEKRKERHAHSLERAADRRGSGGWPQRSGLDMSRTELQRLQEMDAELTKIAEGGQFFRQNGLLYHTGTARGGSSGPDCPPQTVQERSSTAGPYSSLGRALG